MRAVAVVFMFLVMPWAGDTSVEAAADIPDVRIDSFVAREDAAGKWMHGTIKNHGQADALVTVTREYADGGWHIAQRFNVTLAPGESTGAGANYLQHGESERQRVRISVDGDDQSIIDNIAYWPPEVNFPPRHTITVHHPLIGGQQFVAEGERIRWQASWMGPGHQGFWVEDWDGTEICPRMTERGQFCHWDATIGHHEFTIMTDFGPFHEGLVHVFNPERPSAAVASVTEGAAPQDGLTVSGATFSSRGISSLAARLGDSPWTDVPVAGDGSWSVVLDTTDTPSGDYAVALSVRDGANYPNHTKYAVTLSNLLPPDLTARDLDTRGYCATLFMPCVASNMRTTYEVKVTLDNDGELPATGPFQVHMRYENCNGGSQCQWLPVTTWDVDGVAAGQSLTLQHMWDDAGLAGKCQVEIVVDAAASVAERHEDNNLLEGVVAWKDGRGFCRHMF